MLMTGDCVERNYKAAYNLFSKSAKEGYAKSFNKMALMHQKGMGRPVSVRNAFKLYKLAADSGSVQGCYERRDSRAQSQQQAPCKPQAADARRRYRPPRG